MQTQSLFSWIGRALVCGVFIGAGIEKLRSREATKQYIQAKGIPGGNLALAGAITSELVVAPLLVLGIKPRYTATGLLAFLLPTTLVFHDFWNQEGSERQNQMIHFMKNLSIMGGLLGLAERDMSVARIERLRGVQSGVLLPRPTYLETQVEAA